MASSNAHDRAGEEPWSADNAINTCSLLQSRAVSGHVMLWMHLYFHGLQPKSHADIRNNSLPLQDNICLSQPKGRHNPVRLKMSEQLIKSSNDKASDRPAFEIAIAYEKPKSAEQSGGLISILKDKPQFAVERLIQELKNKGLVLKEVEGLSAENFVKIGAPVEVLGHMAETLQIRKPTHFGLDVPFEWDEREVFVRQSEHHSLFSWDERYRCLRSLLNQVVNLTEKDVVLRSNDLEEIVWKPGESLLSKLISVKVVKDVFVLQDENERQHLLHNWAWNWTGFTSQPIDSIYSYFGPKIAIYFTFLGMYTQWLLYPSVAGLFFYYVNMGSWEAIVPPLFSMLAVSWAVLFLQFWKRKNAALLARWNQSSTFDKENGTDLPSSTNDAVVQSKSRKLGISRVEKQAYQKEEWAEHFRSFQNTAAVIGGILCLQLPFEIAYAHLSYIIQSKLLNFLVTGMYLLMIQYFTKLGGKIAVRLTKSVRYASREAEADSVIYKVFGVYFMQSYIGLLYHALFQRDFTMLRQFLIQRLVISQIINNITENLIPYILYRRNRHKTLQIEREAKKDPQERSKRHMPQVEKEFLKSSYTASIENDLEDGLFDDFLELALQFGMVAMFASAFPLVFAFAFVNNLIEIRSDASKLLLVLRRPVPRAVSSIGAWLNIFQYLGVIAICTNCALLMCLYDQQGKWSIEPGLAAILFMEHLLLLVKFGFSCFVPEEPAWVRAKKMSNKAIREQYSKRLLHNLDVDSSKKSLEFNSRRIDL
ncbi:hypothetical protein GOP47_0016837 [Adiantum capillus-veneris]|uniref:Anoctamin-like protein n=1 Tax=Adiantum capillus-veneris TaxID=13818 RepID=A0A9D4UIT7_ADICA|nr:hypothetical protein GOP47_0016837 [Adiantum capillus-veneris]